MSEVEYDLLLDAVSEAVAESPQDNALCAAPAVVHLRRAANDNDLEWPLSPFPAGWHGSC